MPFWKTLSSKVIHKTHWIRLIEDKVVTHNNKELTYTYVQTVHPAVAVVAINSNGKILLQKNYRYTLQCSQWEIPAGHMDDGESPLETAKRELLEETNLVSDHWQELGSIELIAGIGDVRMHLFAATQVTRHEDNHLDEDEPISEQSFLSEDEVRRMLRANEIFSATTLVALYRYFDNIHEKESL